MRVWLAPKMPPKMADLSVLLDGRQVCALASPRLSGASIPAAAAVIPAIPETVMRLIQRV